MNPLLPRMYPEIGAGGYSRIDGTVEFFARINALLKPEMVVVDFGAGRGRTIVDDDVSYRRELCQLKGKCRYVIGMDVAPVVMENPGLDEAHVITPESVLPLEDESIDLIVSDHVFEHIADPQLLREEFYRILKPGGWVCARTPNRWGYIGLGTNLVPNRFHTLVLKRLQRERKEVDVFPTTYRLNTRRAVRRYFSPDRIENYMYGISSEPAYFGSSAFFWRIAQLWARLVPELMSATWMIFLRKKK